MTKSMIETIIDSGIKLTPMMDQYYQIKKNYPKTLLLFRMGDFYELFFEDAREASQILNITLTHRGKLGDTAIPMAGIPHHAAEAYIDRITALGIKVAICEQTENPKDAQGIVKRAVTQIVTPGLPYSLDRNREKHGEQRFIACAFHDESRSNFFLTYLDFTTGNFAGHILKNRSDLLKKIELINPKEFVSFLGQWENLSDIEQYLDNSKILHTYIGQEYFDPKLSGLYIEKLISSYKFDKTLQKHESILFPIAALSYYICSTQTLSTLVHIKQFCLITDDKNMGVTFHTLSGLEIISNNPNDYKNSIIGFCDRTKTAIGARALKTFFISPLKNYSEIIHRQNLIKFFLNDIEKLEVIREKLKDVRDIERIMAKASTGKITPSDLLNLANTANIYNDIRASIIKGLPNNIINLLSNEQINNLLKLATDILENINDEIGASLEKGNLIRTGKNETRDNLANLCNGNSKELERLEDKYKSESNISKLRIKSNNIAGFFIEVTRSHTDKVPTYFKRTQTLVNAERYTTDELLTFEHEVNSAKYNLEKLEREIFQNFVLQIKTHAEIILNLANNLANLDIFQSLAWVAIQENFCCPTLSTTDKKIEIKDAWHPLIKSFLKDRFVTHDLSLNENRYFGLITGPNMAGKTTVMREVAIIQFLAQIGSFVPAKSADLGICDYLFSRLGASDNITNGQSTFMMEMTETSEILRHASKKSLIILDEVGRGTSTFDGLSIAWALVEHIIYNTKALTLFATHYHELIDLINGIPQGKNLTVETINSNGNVQFLYRLIEQAASQSYGIYVAKLAGIPKNILSRAQEILDDLENKATSKQLDLFDNLTTTTNTLPPKEIPHYLLKMEDSIKSIDLLNITPINAMLKIQEIKEQIKEEL